MGISEQWLDKRSVEWLVLTSRVMSDEVVQADAAYLVGQTRDNASSVLERGAELWQKRLVTRLACQRGGDAAGYCGWDFSLRTLQILGVPPDAVVAVEARETKPNTLTELVSLALLAKQSGWVRILLVASPFHQLRSFITAVTAANREHPSLRIYNCVGLPLPWNERVIHSQGVLTGRRVDLLAKEIERIQDYQRRSRPYPPLVSVEEALDYLDRRDAA